MQPIIRSEKLSQVHSDIRGPVYVEAMKMIAEGTPVLRLNTGNPATFGFTMPPSVRHALLENADKAVGYCDFRGMPAARQAILEYETGKGIQGLTLDDIFVGNGVSEMAQFAITTLLNYGDEILLPSPSYSLWTNVTLIAGAKPVFYTCDEASDWYPDVEDIRRKITSRTRAILIINPNNPTGALYPRELLEQIVAIAREKELILLSDEIYDRLVMDGKEHVSTAALCPDLPILTFNGLSKSHMICGFRCGWLAVSGPREVTKDFIAGMVALTSMRLCGNALTQLVIPAALQDEQSTRELLIPGGRLYEQREAAVQAIRRFDCLSVVKNTAAFYIFPRIDLTKCPITDDKKFAMDLLHEKHILLVPGSGFDWPQPDHFRVVMLPEAKDLARAMTDVGEFLQTYRQ